MLRAALSPSGLRRPLVAAAAGLLSACVLAVAAPAAADEAPPEGPCDFAKLGDACETDDGEDGVCVKHTCSRLSYAGDEPESVDYECKRCASKKEAKAEAKAAKAVKADEAAKADADATNSDVPPRKGGCAIDPAGLGLSGAAGLLAVLFVGAARRRRGSVQPAKRPESGRAPSNERSPRASGARRTARCRSARDLLA